MILSHLHFKKDAGYFYHLKNDLLFPLTTESAQQPSSILRITRDKIILRKKIQNIKKRKSLTTNNKSLQCRSGNQPQHVHVCLLEHRSHFLMGMPITIKSSASVTSWRSNTDSACLFSSAMPSVSPSLAKAIGLYRWLK